MVMSESQNANAENDKGPTDYESYKSNQSRLTKGYKATQLYMQLAQASNNKAALQVLSEVVDENRVHVGESMKLFYELANEEEKVLAHKTPEVENLINEILK
jgi:hypothetical protein